MELKVWVEGIQRVVCGVTDVTTCQDIVYALAHATGQTGRFTLIERWRHNERLLPPNEHPLKVLAKWGEYASNVQFILRRSEKKSPSKAVASSSSPTANNPKELKKSFTFSGSHGNNAPLSPNAEPKRCVIKVVPQQREPPKVESPVKVERPKQPPSYDEAVSRSSRHSNTSHDSSSPSSKRRHLLAEASSVAPAPRNVISSSPFSTDHKGEESPKPEEAGLNQQDPQLRDLIRLVNLQRDKLSSQNAELSQFDSEIVYWEKKLEEQEARLGALEAELSLLERTNSDRDAEMSQLEQHQPLFADAVEKGQQEDRVLRSKLSVLRAQIANCETEVLQCRQRMRRILEEIAEERKRNAIQWEEKEAQTKKQLKELEEQLMEHRVQGEEHKTILAQLEVELSQFEDVFGNRNSEAKKLYEELREANLESLSMAIADDMKYVADGNFHMRSGSTRRIMGSPRQLENAVPTSKNPHGVWV